MFNRPAILAILLTCLGTSAWAQPTNTSERADLQSFRIISERNIFDPNRSSRADRTVRREREPERRARVESISLLGTMSYEKGWFAFFDGSSGEFRKALQPNDAIAGYTISAIAPNHVRLEATNSPPIELRVGMQMKKQEEGEWAVSSSGDVTAVAPPTATTEASTESSASGGESDVIKRLMQQREQELQK
jgi:hypothetical protein